MMVLRSLSALALVLTGVAACLAFGSTASGCGPACHPSERVVTDGERQTVGAVLVYATSAPDGPFLPFEGGTLLRIRHGLGVVPFDVDVQLAFTQRPLTPGAGGFSFSAGNQALVLRYDEEEIAIKNDSCANYFVRVHLEGAAGEQPVDGGQ